MQRAGEIKEEAFHKDNRRYLIVGCGQAYQCRHSHPISSFVTVDIDESIKPEVVADAESSGFIEKITKKYNKFNAIVFEYFPFSRHTYGNDYKLLDLSDLITEDGYMIYLGSHLSAAIKNFGTTKTIWYMNNEQSNTAIVIVSNSKTLNLRHGIYSYLQPEIQKNEVFHKIELTTEFLRRIKILEFLNNSRFFFPALIAKPEPITPITVDMLKSVIKDYDSHRPQSFHYKLIHLFSSNNKAKFEKFFSQFNDGLVLSNEDLIEFLYLIHNKINDLREVKNNQYYIDTESSRYIILKNIIMKILNHLLHSGLVQDKKLETEFKKVV